MGEEAFSVTLRFGGAPERLHVPFAALVAFADPAAQFGLRFEAGEEEAAAPEAAAAEAERAGARGGAARRDGRAGGNVVDIRAFRRRED